MTVAVGGNDTLLGGTGDDTLNGGTGTDSASYSESLTAVTASLDTNSATGEGSDTFLVHDQATFCGTVRCS
jgi:Ca2+-binding RTX toxin-like protein